MPRHALPPLPVALRPAARAALHRELVSRECFEAANDVWTVDATVGGRHRGYEPRHARGPYVDPHPAAISAHGKLIEARWRTPHDIDVDGARHALPEVEKFTPHSVWLAGFEFAPFVGARAAVVGRVKLNRDVGARVAVLPPSEREAAGLPANLFPFPIVVDAELPPNVVKFLDGITGAERLVEIDPF
jgi:hypothetical protein